MKVRFKSEEDMNEYASYQGNNSALVDAYGMNIIPVVFSDDGWWDVLNENGNPIYTINVSNESHHFDILEK